MRPGDGIAVEVSPDDVETAIYVILIKSGTASEREAASVPVEEPFIVTPEPGDLAPARSAR